MKLLLYFVFFIAVITIVYAPNYYEGNEIHCSVARFCDSENLECSYITDNICPESYGDWQSCTMNNYNKACTPCDPDCGDCGLNVALNVPNSNANSQFLVVTNSSGYMVSGDVRSYSFSLYFVNLRGGLSSVGYSGSIYSCPNEVCGYQISRPSPNAYCSTYNYATKFNVIWTNGSMNIISTVFDSGKTTPSVSITGPDESNNFNVVAGCLRGDRDVDVRDVYFLIEKLQGESYIKVNSNGDECSAPSTCNIIGQSTQRNEGYFTYDFNDDGFRNGDYRMTAVAIAGALDEGEVVYGIYPPNSGSVDFVIDKGLMGETGGTYQGSKVLNIILARIKTWI